VIPATPLQTGWPAMAALALLLGSLALSGRRLLPDRRLMGGLLGVAVLALFVRLGVVPALARHIYDGHEAEYWDIFRGVRPLSRGGTVLYPAMQWLWWGLGKLLPADPRVPVVLSAVVGALSAATLGAAVARLSRPGAGVVAALVVALHPVHAAWSSSAYNVIFPWAAGSLALLASAALVQPRTELDRRGSLGLGGVLGAALALTVATRLDQATWAVPCVLLLVFSWGGARSPARVRAWALGPLLLGAILAGLAAWPLLFPGEIPGTGERGLAFQVNVGLLDPYAPLNTAPALALVGVGAILALRRWPLPTVALIALAVGNHLLMAGFDDFGDRHTLLALPAVAWCLGAGAFAVPGAARRLGAALALGGLLVVASGLVPMRQTFYGSEAHYRQLLDVPPYDELPRYSLDQVDTVVAPPGRCGLVAEDQRVARSPPVSHFNLLRPQEEAGLRGDDGCLRWCADVQDWRWSSRGVRDRAARLRHLFRLQAVAVVDDPESGYVCLVWQVGRRRL